MADVPLHRLGMQQKLLLYFTNLTSQPFRIWILALSVHLTNVWRNLVGAVSFHTYIYIYTLATRNSAFVVPSLIVLDPAGGLWSSARDLSALVSLFMSTNKPANISSKLKTPKVYLPLTPR